MLNKGDACGDKNYAVKLDMICNKDAKEPKILGTEKFNADSCANSLIIESKHNCPDANVYAVLKFVNQYSIFVGGVLILIGIFLVFLGNKLMIITVFLITMIITVTLVFLLMFGFILPGGANPAIVWVVLGIAVIVGIVLGFLVAKYKKTLIGFALGGYLGYLLGILLYNALLNRIEASPTVSVYIILAYFLVNYCSLYYSRWIIELFPLYPYYYNSYILLRSISRYQRN
jgi:hypothetical protein